MPHHWEITSNYPDNTNHRTVLLAFCACRSPMKDPQQYGINSRSWYVFRATNLCQDGAFFPPKFWEKWHQTHRKRFFSNADLLQNFSPVIIPKNRLFKPEASGHKSNFGDPKKPHILHFWIIFCSPLVKQKLPEILSSKVYVHPTKIDILHAFMGCTHQGPINFPSIVRSIPA